jgi:hypothetical protein
MRFRVRVEVVVEADSLEGAQVVATDVEAAAYAAAGGHAVPERPGGWLTKTDLGAADDDAAGTLAAEGLASGISSVRHRAG